MLHATDHKVISNSRPPQTGSRIGLVRLVTETVNETFRLRGEMMERYPRSFLTE